MFYDFCLFLVRPWSDPEWGWVFVHLCLSVCGVVCMPPPPRLALLLAKMAWPGKGWPGWPFFSDIWDIWPLIIIYCDLPCVCRGAQPFMGGCWLYSPTLFGLVSPTIFVDTDRHIAELFLIAGALLTVLGMGWPCLVLAMTLSLK